MYSVLGLLVTKGCEFVLHSIVTVGGHVLHLPSCAEIAEIFVIGPIRDTIGLTLGTVTCGPITTIFFARDSKCVIVPSMPFCHPRR